MSASPDTGLAAFDEARWRERPAVRDVIVLGDVGVLRQSFDAATTRFEVAVEQPRSHVLLWVLGQAPGRFDTRLDGRADAAPGARLRNAYLLPAGVPSHWRGPGGTLHDCLHFHFSPDWLVRLAAESGLPPGAAELPLRAGLDDPALDSLVRALVAAAGSPTDPAGAAFAEQWSMLAALRLLRAPPPPVRITLAPWRLARALALIEENLAGDVSLSDLAGAAGLSRFHFARAFRAEIGEAPHAHLRRRRCEKAKALLLEGRMSLAEIAAACGFAHQAHFTTAFRKVVGTTPGRWRQARLA